MLNPDLHLNTQLFEVDCAKAPTRDGFGVGLEYLGEHNDDVVVLSADLSESTRCDGFMKKFPERYIECGVSEQNMALVAAGLGVCGKIPFISSYAVFSPGRNWEVLRTTTVYNNLPVKIAGHHAGIVTGPDGPTHQATEDIASVRSWPGMTVLVPCDALQAEKATIASADINSPVYLRFSREKTPIITTQETPFEIGKAYAYWVSEKPQVLIASSGHMVYQALAAARILEKENISSTVLSLATIKPLDKKTIIAHAKTAKAIVSVEDHQIEGGLGGALAELFSKEYPIRMGYVGLKNTFAESASGTDLLRQYGLDALAIACEVKRVLDL
ncbi:MAG: transketolase, transketolase [Parcubacteria group bacterium GW2011_GWC1_41_7]|nr:MAG: transketolase, transketolase [Parcubacteria group bacterium GW2011_GWC1_41_7]